MSSSHSVGRVVAKFGGTSLADAAQIRKVAQIVCDDQRRRYLVVSAPGKREPGDQKITDLLLTCGLLATQKLDYQQPLDLIRERYRQIADDLNVAFIDEPMDELTRELAKRARGDESLATRDWIAARGEYFHARLIADFLHATFVPAGECIRFDAKDRLDPASYDNLAARMTDPDQLYVVPGFYGRDVLGRIKTFPRGGSDITGAVVARAVGAVLYENWTDVPGMLMADPRVVESPRPIPVVTYRELRELAYMGATVLHEEVIFPVWEADIPIQIKNTNAPDAPGTRIVKERTTASDLPVTGIAGRTGFSAITIEKWRMNQEVGFGHRALGVLLTHDISFEHIPSAIDGMSIIVSDDELADKGPVVVDELRRVLEASRVEILGDLALIATVGEGMAYRVGVAGTVFEALRQEGVNVRMISQGASEISILIGVAARDYERAVRALYAAFVPAAAATAEVLHAR